MNEKPLEWIVVCGESAGHKIGRIAALSAAVVLFLFSMLTGQIFSLIALVLFAALFAWLQSHAFVEYEFSYFSEDMDIAVIYNKARRKKKMSLTLAEVEYMVKKIEPQQETKYFCNKANVSNIYTLVLNKEGKRTAVVMEPDLEFIKVIEMKRKMR